MRNIAIEIHGEQVDGVIGIPASGSGPGVIVIQEWWGLVPHIQQLVARFAEAGFVALAIDHYRGVETTEPDEAEKLMMGLKVASAAEDFAASASYLIGRDDVTGPGIAAVGFCMGGGLALLAPTVSEHIACTTAFYPAMPWPEYAPDWSRYAGKSALIHKAESDESWAGPRIAEYAAEITANGGSVEMLDYPGSEHAFFNDERPEVYSAEHAAIAWERTCEFIRAHCG